MHDAFRAELLNGNSSDASLRTYFQWVIVNREHSQTCSILEGLVRQAPRHISCLSLYIAACLEAGRNREALTAIRCLLAHAEPDNELLDAALAVQRRLSPSSVQSETTPLLSVCMIACNEASYLGRCLYHIRDLADEIVLVDTGSTDRTRDIALLFDARIYAFAWCDDFSAARNFSLQKAQGRWTLVLDADEVIAGQDAAFLRSLLSTPDASRFAYALTTRNYCHTVNDLGWQPNDGTYGGQEAGVGWFPSVKVRLFRNDPGIHFHFPVHERVEPSLEKAGYAVKSCHVPVHHYGHLNEARNHRKAHEYYKLGYAKLDLMGDDPGALRELAVQAGQLEQWPQAVALWQRLLRIRPDYVEAMVNLAGACWNCGNYDQSLFWARKAVKHDGKVKEGRFNEAVSLLMLGCFDQARDILTTLVQSHPGYLAAGFMLAVTHACLKEHGKANRIRTALEQSPVGRALPMALDDLMQRLKKAGQDLAAHNVETVLLRT